MVFRLDGRERCGGSESRRPRGCSAAETAAPAEAEAMDRILAHAPEVLEVVRDCTKGWLSVLNGADMLTTYASENLERSGLDPFLATSQKSFPGAGSKRHIMTQLT